jgi:hypothetical protein
MGSPKTLDGLPLVAPLAFDKGAFLYITGAGDNPAENGRGEGSPFVLTRSTTGTSTLEWSFNDVVKLVGGSGQCSGAGAGDEFSTEAYAPATQVVEVTPGEGSVVVVPTGYSTEDGPLSVIVPMPSGTHNVVPGTEVPVPNSVGEPAFYSWSKPPFGLGDVTPGAPADPLEQGYNLYTSDIPLARQSNRIQLLGNRAISVDVVNVELLPFLPHWKFKATLKTVADRDVTVVWEVKCQRYRTTKIW